MRPTARLLLSALTVTACVSSVTSTPQPERLALPTRVAGLLRVRVVDSLQRPIDAARVAVDSVHVNPINTLTNDSGVVSLPGVPSGRRHIALLRIGYNRRDTTIVMDSTRGTSVTVMLHAAVVLFDGTPCCEREAAVRPAPQPRDTTPPPPPLYGVTYYVRAPGPDSVPPSASFLIVNEATHEERRQPSPHDMVWQRTGVTNFGALPAGTYRFIFEADGFRPETLSHVVLPVAYDSSRRIVRLTRLPRLPRCDVTREPRTGAIPFCAIDTPPALDTTGPHPTIPLQLADGRAPVSARVALTIDASGHVVPGSVHPVDTGESGALLPRRMLEQALVRELPRVRFTPAMRGGIAWPTTFEIELRLTSPPTGTGEDVVLQQPRPWGIELMIGRGFVPVKPPAG